MTPEHDYVVQLSAWNDLQRTVEAIAREDAKVRMHLGQEWWADLDKQQALQFINRKQRATLASLDPALEAAPTSTSSEISVQEGNRAQSAERASVADEEGADSSAAPAEQSPVHQSDPPGTVEVLEDGTVLNEDGQPFMDIREPLSSLSPALAAKAGESTAPEPDDYWLPASVARRRKLLKAVLDSDSEEEGDDAPAFEEATAVVSSAPVGDGSRPPAAPSTSSSISADAARSGRLVRSTIISQPTAALPEDKPGGAKKSGPPTGKKTHTSRKAVAFADTAEVSDGEGTVKKVVMPTPDKDKATKDDMFAGFKRGFLTGAGSAGNRKKAIILPPPPEQPASHPTPSIQVNGETVPAESSASAAQPVQPARKSLFSQRKALERNQAAARATAIPASSQGVQNRGGQAMQTAVVERAAPAKSDAPAKESAWTKVSKGEVKERPLVPVPAAPQRPPAKAATDDSEDEPLEYTDDEMEDDAFDMDEAMLAREAALAYHAKRAEIGRKGLGGWTGAMGPDGEIEWDREIVPNDGEDTPRSNVVGFGERIDPAGNGDDDRSISIPTIVPAGSQMEGAIRTGKLVDGKLVVPAGQDSEDSESDQEGQDKSAFAKERKQAKRQKQELLKRIASGDWRELAEAEAQQQQRQTVSSGPKGDDLPKVLATPIAAPSASVADSAPPAPTPRISRFKAARMAAKQ